MSETYFTIAKNGQTEMEVKKSRFITNAKRIETEDEAKAFISQIKKEHWKANHNCSAFILGKSMEIQRSSDDGEPNGTAGVPMLEVLKKKELINLVVVVTRYFGGVKLGAGGLIRAYAGSVSQALKEIGIVRGVLQQEIRIILNYPQLDKIQNFFAKTEEYTVKETIFTENAQMLVLVDKENVEKLEAEIVELLNGQVEIQLGEFSWNEILIRDE